MDVSKLRVDLDLQTGLKVINGQYRVQRGIGHGLSGKVLLGEDIEKRRLVAIKTINRVDKTRLITKTYMNHALKIKREIKIMKECNHPNVVKLCQVIDDLKFDKILLILEYCKFGDIDWKSYNHYTEKYKRRNNLTINKILRDVINGLEYLHCYKGIIHRDLKPSNLLIDQDYKIKISDFGVSLILENNANDEKELGKSVGTPAFFAPELCQFVNNRHSMISELDNSSIRIDCRIDIWSLGVVLYCLAFHMLPFDGCNEFDLFKHIVNDPLKFPNINKSSRTTEDDFTELGLLEDLIRSLLEKDPERRLSIKQIKSNEFTLFDLTDKERAEFLTFNDSYIKDGVKEGIAGRMRFIFRRDKKKDEPTATPADFLHLEPIDDLLDSYLESESDLGSEPALDEPTFKEPALDEPILEPTLDEPLQKPLLEDPVLYGQLLDELSQQESRLNQISSNLTTATKLNAPAVPSYQRQTPVSVPRVESSKEAKQERLRPSPLILQKTLFDLSRELRNQKRSLRDSPQPPIDESVVTIGVGTPTSTGSIKLHMSPSKRHLFQQRSKRDHDEQQPTIGSLHSILQTSVNLVEPPAIFGVTPMLSPGSQLTSSSGSRKNSMTSTHSFSKMTGSQSSLNLNAYLTDESSPIAPNSAREQGDGIGASKTEKNEKPQRQNPSKQPKNGLANFKEMHEYLNDLA